MGPQLDAVLKENIALRFHSLSPATLALGSDRLFVQVAEIMFHAGLAKFIIMTCQRNFLFPHNSSHSSPGSIFLFRSKLQSSARTTLQSCTCTRCWLLTQEGHKLLQHPWGPWQLPVPMSPGLLSIPARDGWVFCRCIRGWAMEGKVLYLVFVKAALALTCQCPPLPSAALRVSSPAGAVSPEALGVWAAPNMGGAHGAVVTWDHNYIALQQHHRGVSLKASSPHSCLCPQVCRLTFPTFHIAAHETVGQRSISSNICLQFL